MKFFLKQKKISKFLLLIIFLVFVIFSLNLFQKEVKGFFYSWSGLFQKSLWQAGYRISGFLGVITNFKNLKKENEELKLKNQGLLTRTLSLEELKKENLALREALEIGLKKEFKLEMAEVISKDISQDAILINKGSKEGILKDLIVITQQKVLLGKITEVYENFSRVSLISNKKSSFDAKIPGPEILGVVKGKGRFEAYLDFIPKDKEIKEGDLVVSDSLSGIYPKDLLVGLIKKVEQSDVKPFQQAEISLFFDIANLENVFLIFNF